MLRFIGWILIWVLLTGCTTHFYHGPVSDHFDGERFFYDGEKRTPGHFYYSFFTLIHAIWQNPWPKVLPDIKKTSVTPIVTDGIKVTFINHSTVLIQTDHLNILTDPVYSLRTSPIQWVGPIRRREPGIHFNQLPHIDVVLISHNHYDHLDINTLAALNKKFHPLIIVPLGDKAMLYAHRIFHVVELDWWQEYKINHLTITFLPARHSTARFLNDFDKTLWGSYGLKIDHTKIYFGGDSGYGPHYKKIRKRWGSPDLAFLPIGAYEPRYLLHHDHLNPADAIRVHQELGSHYSTGIHYGTFQLSSESFDQPVKDLELARAQSRIPNNRFFISQEGEPWNFLKD